MPSNRNEDRPQLDDLERQFRRGLEWVGRHPSILLFGFFLLLLLFLLPTIIYQVNAQERAVVLRFGELQRVDEPGLQYKFPYPIETAELINTQEPFEMSFSTKSINQTTRRTSGVQDPQEDTLMLTGDLGVARVEWQVQYKKSDPVRYVFNVPEAEHRQLIRDTTLSTMRRVIGDKFVSRVITVAREEIRRNVEAELQDVMDRYSTGITIEGIEIQSTEPPVQKVIDAFKEVDSARQDRETLRNEALRQQEKILNETEGEAQKRISEARGQAAQIRNQAKGEAERFDHIVTQFEAAPKITRTRMFLETMQDVMQASNRVYIVDEHIQGLLPHLQLRENKE